MLHTADQGRPRDKIVKTLLRVAEPTWQPCLDNREGTEEVDSFFLLIPSLTNLRTVTRCQDKYLSEESSMSQWPLRRTKLKVDQVTVVDDWTPLATLA